MGRARIVRGAARAEPRPASKVYLTSRVRRTAATQHPSTCFELAQLAAPSSTPFTRPWRAPAGHCGARTPRRAPRPRARGSLWRRPTRRPSGPCCARRGRAGRRRTYGEVDYGEVEESFSTRAHTQWWGEGRARQFLAHLLTQTQAGAGAAFRAPPPAASLQTHLACSASTSSSVGDSVRGTYRRRGQRVRERGRAQLIRTLSSACPNSRCLCVHIWGPRRTSIGAPSTITSLPRTGRGEKGTPHRPDLQDMYSTAC